MTLPACCTDLNIDVLHLLFPERLPEDGAEFYRAHGLGALDLAERVELLRDAPKLDNGNYYIRHRCAQLGDDGRCQIYTRRPAICRTFDCANRTDCACAGRGWIAVDAIAVSESAADE